MAPCNPPWREAAPPPRCHPASALRHTLPHRPLHPPRLARTPGPTPLSLAFSLRVLHPTHTHPPCLFFRTPPAGSAGARRRAPPPPRTKPIPNSPNTCPAVPACPWAPRSVVVAPRQPTRPPTHTPAPFSPRTPDFTHSFGRNLAAPELSKRRALPPYRVMPAAVEASFLLLHAAPPRCAPARAPPPLLLPWFLHPRHSGRCPCQFVLWITPASPAPTPGPHPHPLLASAPKAPTPQSHQSPPSHPTSPPPPPSPSPSNARQRAPCGSYAPLGPFHPPSHCQ